MILPKTIADVEIYAPQIPPLPSATNDYGTVLESRYDIMDNCDNIFWKYYFVTGSAIFKFFYYSVIKHIQELNIELEMFNQNQRVLNSDISSQLLNMSFGLNPVNNFLVDVSNIKI